MHKDHRFMSLQAVMMRVYHDSSDRGAIHVHSPNRHKADLKVETLDFVSEALKHLNLDLREIE
jgi:hypothetical protein